MEVYVDLSDGISKYHIFTFADIEELQTTYGYKVYKYEGQVKKTKDLKPSGQIKRGSRSYSAEERRLHLLSMRGQLSVICPPGSSDKKQLNC